MLPCNPINCMITAIQIFFTKNETEMLGSDSKTMQSGEHVNLLGEAQHVHSCCPLPPSCSDSLDAIIWSSVIKYKTGRGKELSPNKIEEHLLEISCLGSPIN